MFSQTELLQKSILAVPSPRQRRFLKKPFYAFIHFGINTFTGREWGDGTEDPALFIPEQLDCDQWVDAVKQAGMTGIVLTAKHHDGFCLWQTGTTLHSVKSSPWQNGKGDVVRACAEACKKGGIDFGFYLSPWDRHCPLYGTDAYNDYYKAQLTELLTQYGDVFYVWFDGACGEGPNGKKQNYDFDGYIRLIRKYQPDACIFHDGGPDIRWIGNEAGMPRRAEWAVVPKELCIHAESCIPLRTQGGDLTGIYSTWPDLGSMEIIRSSKGLCFCPAETDMSIRPGWFYHENEKTHSLEKLFSTYITSVGGNSTFHLNIPPMPNGLLDPGDIQRLEELGNQIRTTFEKKLFFAHPPQYTSVSDTQGYYHLSFAQKESIRTLVLEEDLLSGQRIEQFQLQYKNDFGKWEPFYYGFTVGNKKICIFEHGMDVNELRVAIIAARGQADGLSVSAYG